MTCEDYQAIFSDYYEEKSKISSDTTIDDVSSIVEAHLLECDFCASEYRKFASLLGDISTLPYVGPPKGFHESLMKYVLEHAGDNHDDSCQLIQHTAKRKQPRWRKPVAMVAVAACWAFAMVWVLGALDFIPMGSGQYRQTRDESFPFIEHHHEESMYVEIVPFAAFDNIFDDTITDNAPRGRVGDFADDYHLITQIHEYNNDAKSRNNTALAVFITLIITGFCGAVIFVIGRAR